MLQEFKEFALKGDLVTIAVGLVLALAFTAVVNSLVEHIIMPVVGIVVGERSFETLTWEIGDAVILYGAFITAVLTFVIIAATLFFLVVRPYNQLRARRERGEETDIPEPEELLLLREIARNTSS